MDAPLGTLTITCKLAAYRSIGGLFASAPNSRRPEKPGRSITGHDHAAADWGTATDPADEK